MTFETFPYANTQDYNLDWILRKLRELEERINAIEVKDYDDIIAEILRRLNICENNIVNINLRIDDLTNVVNAHYLDLSQKIITINNILNLMQTAINDLTSRVVMLETKVNVMFFHVVSFDDFEHMAHLPNHQYWVTDGENLELWLGDQQLKFGIPLYRTVLTTIQNSAPVFGKSAITTVQEAL